MGNVCARVRVCVRVWGMERRESLDPGPVGSRTHTGPTVIRTGKKLVDTASGTKMVGAVTTPPPPPSLVLPMTVLGCGLGTTFEQQDFIEVAHEKEMYAGHGGSYRHHQRAVREWGGPVSRKCHFVV